MAVNTSISRTREETLREVETELRHMHRAAAATEQPALWAAVTMVEGRRLLASAHHDRMCALAEQEFAQRVSIR